MHVLELAYYSYGTHMSYSTCLDIMFLTVRASCSLAVRAMRACTQGGSGSLPPRRGVWGSLRPPGKQGVWGAAGLPILYLAKLKICFYSS